jgi:hypothetical protein
MLIQNECFSQWHLVIAVEDSCEIENQYPQLNLFPDIQTSVGEKLEVTCFYEIQYTTAFWAEMNVSPNAKW